MSNKDVEAYIQLFQQDQEDILAETTIWLGHVQLLDAYFFSLYHMCLLNKNFKTSLKVTHTFEPLHAASNTMHAAFNYDADGGIGTPPLHSSSMHAASNYDAYAFNYDAYTSNYDAYASNYDA